MVVSEASLIFKSVPGGIILENKIVPETKIICSIFSFVASLIAIF